MPVTACLRTPPFCAPGFGLRPCVPELFCYRVVDACLHSGNFIAFHFSPQRGSLSALSAPPPPATSRPRHSHYVSRAARKAGTHEHGFFLSIRRSQHPTAGRAPSAMLRVTPLCLLWVKFG